MRSIGAFFLVLLAVATKPESRWKLFWRTPDIVVWIDSARIDSTRVDKMVGVWLRFDYAQPQALDDMVYAQSQIQVAIDCHAEKVRDLALRLYGSDGRPLGPESDKVPPGVFSFADHPFGHGTFKGICGWLRGPDRWRVIIGALGVEPN